LVLRATRRRAAAPMTAIPIPRAPRASSAYPLPVKAKSEPDGLASSDGDPLLPPPGEEPWSAAVVELPDPDPHGLVVSLL
jgi:hypothetical protein